MNVALYIARRYFVAKKSTNAITVISWISVLAIAVGTSALIIILSGMNGLTGLVQTLYNSFNPDIKITAVSGKVFTANDAFIADIKNVNGVAYVSKTLDDNMLLKFNDQLQITHIKGVDENFTDVTRFDTLVVEGKYFSPEKNNQLVLGKGVAYRLGVSLSNVFTPVSVFCPKRGVSESLNPEDAFNEEKCHATGFFSINDDFDFTYGLMSYETARELLQYPASTVTALEVGLKPNADMDAVKNEIQKIAGNKYQLKNKYEQNDVLFKTLKTEKLWTFIILAFVLLIATFNIIGALTMLIIEKKKDVQTLSAMGADVNLIRKIFMTEGLMIIFIGASIGILIGYGLCLLQQHFGFVSFEEGYIVDAYPIEVRFSDFVLIMATVLCTGFIAAIYPVRVFTKQNLFQEN
ncbi:MAG TPA: FtsX-like permease family protein [Bacteroidia bacterium]|nr:FtsX-like permease family protein [Bacteroidia bacterium]